MRRRDHDGLGPRQAIGERLPRRSSRTRLEGVHRRAVGEEDAHAAFFSSPSACSASCTFGRAPTRFWNAAMFGQRARSMLWNLVQFVSTKRYASATVNVFPVR